MVLSTDTECKIIVPGRECEFTAKPGAAGADAGLSVVDVHISHILRNKLIIVLRGGQLRRGKMGTIET